MLGKRKSSGKLVAASNEAGASTDISEALVAHEKYALDALERQRGILSRIMPSKADQKIDEFKSRLVEEQITSRLEFFRMYQEFQRQALKEALDEMLRSAKTAGRGKTSTFFVAEQARVEGTVNSIITNFEDTIEQAMSEAEELSNEVIKAARLQRLQSSLDRINQSGADLLAQFAAIINEGV